MIFDMLLLVVGLSVFYLGVRDGQWLSAWLGFLGAGGAVVVLVRDWSRRP